MVNIHPRALAARRRQGRFIYICGCDGTGKSTQAKLLLKKLHEQGYDPRHLWLRFPFFLSLPLLLYARWRGLSWYEELGAVRHGYWDFRCSWLLRKALPWLLWIDAGLAALPKIVLPIWAGRTIVCERFVIDMLVDLAVALDDRSLHRQLPGKLYLSLIPRNASVFVLDLDGATIRARRQDLQVDRRLDARLSMFRRVAADLGLPMYSSEIPAAELNDLLLERIGLEHGS